MAGELPCAAGPGEPSTVLRVKRRRRAQLLRALAGRNVALVAAARTGRLRPCEVLCPRTYGRLPKSGRSWTP
jgi:hypothetical protein